MARSGKTMWNGRYGPEESSRRKNYPRTASNEGPLTTPAQRRAFKEELLAGKKKYEESIGPTNVHVPIEFIKAGVKRKAGE